MAVDGEVLGSAGSGAAAGFQVGGPWGAVIGGGIGLVSGLAGSKARKRAEEEQRRRTQQAIAGQAEARGNIMTRENPWEAAGLQGLNALQTFNYRPVTDAQVRADPGYQFALTEGLRGTEGSAASRGGLYSGKAGQDLIDYASGTANRFFNDAFNRNETAANNRFSRLNTLTGYGERSVGRQNTADTHYADSVGTYLTGHGNASAAAALAGGRAEQNALGQFGGGLMDMFMNKTPSSGYDSSGQRLPISGSRGFYNEGGPVNALEVLPDHLRLPVGMYNGGGPVQPQTSDRITQLQQLLAFGQDRPIGGKAAGLPTQRYPSPSRPTYPMNLDPAESAAYDAVMNLWEEELQRLQFERNAGPPRTPSGYNGGGPVMEMRDGRMVPKVGTRSPRPGQAAGTGGGMSREAILQQLEAPAAAASAPAPRQQQTMRDLQIQKALKDAGAYNLGGPVKRKNYAPGGKVVGPGGVDKVPAWLTNNEHVITAPEVAALGGGSPLVGHNVLMQFRRNLME